MELNGYVEELRSQLAVAAAAGGDEAMQLAERLVAPLDAAARLVIQEALADAVSEISRELAPGAVEIRLRGRDLTFVVASPPVDAEPEAPAVDTGRPGEGVEGTTSRISFRPPDHLKARIEDAAEREGLSVNTFLIRTLSAALDPGRRSATTNARGTTSLEGWFR